jgi:hypothetical protein
MTTPKPGSMAWCRAWFDRRIKRGAQVRIAGRKARILSASGGYIHARIWATGQRVTVRPTEVVFA